MIQTTFSVPLEVRPESSARLSLLIDKFKRDEDRPESGGKNFERLLNGLPMVHFMSMSVFEDPSYDPIFIIEANFDGPADQFWPHFEKIAAETVREMLRCCKRPLDGDGDLYDAVIKGPGASVTSYLQARTQGPSVFHHGNRGMTRKRIIDEARLFRAIRAELDAPENQGPEPYRGLSAARLRNALRDRLLPEHPWLNEPAEDRIPTSQRIGDLWRLFFFAAQVLLVLALPGIIAAALLPQDVYIGAVVLLAVAAIVWIARIRTPLGDTGVETDFNLVAFLTKSLPTIALVLIPPLVAHVVLGLAVVALLDALTDSVPGGFDDWWWPVAHTILLGQLGLIVVVPGIVLWLRFLERRDSSQDAPPVDEEEVAKMARHEDWVSQNHMGSIVHIRPGVLRTIVVKAGHRALGLLLRVKATDGYLGSMRTVHFAHWAFLNNGSRLLFFSNFDQSWGSYLDDFIEKAHTGLTLAWGCGVGFPPTRFLIFDGASHGRRFKNWALASRAVSRFWFSAYPELSVDQIERNFRIAEGLRDLNMGPEELDAWMRDL